MDVTLGKMRETSSLVGCEPDQNLAKSFYPRVVPLTASSSNSPKELITFLSREWFPLSGGYSIQRNMYNPDTM
jgi:hypothetical protein